MELKVHVQCKFFRQLKLFWLLFKICQVCQNLENGVTASFSTGDEGEE